MTKGICRGILLATLLCAAAALRAQHGGGPGGPGGGGVGGGGMGGGGGMQRGGIPPFGGNSGSFPRPTMPGGINPGDRREPPRGPSSGPTADTGSMRGGLQLGPPGRFWDDKTFAKDLGLRKDQQKRMDAIFDSNRAALVESYRALQVEEKRLEHITHERPLDEGRVFAGIDAVMQASGALEKAKAHMLMQIRKELDPDQVTRMDKFREEPPEAGQ